jgi:hypothetical protein
MAEDESVHAVTATQSATATPVSVVLASQSGVKVMCLRNFYDVTHQNLVCVHTLVVDTDYVQPLGIEQAEACVDQRLDVAIVAAKPDTALLVALENYVYYDEDADRFRDACLLGVRRIHGIVVDDTRFSSLVVDHTVLVPELLNATLKAAMAEGGEPLEMTCGALLRNRFGSHPDFWETDWFVATGASFNRREQINMLLQANCELLNVLPALPLDPVSVSVLTTTVSTTEPLSSAPPPPVVVDDSLE